MDFENSEINPPNSIQDILLNEFKTRTQTNPAYSLRAYARSLQMDISSLSKIMKGQRKAGSKVIRTLGEKLELSPDSIMELIKSVKAKHRNIEYSTYEIEKLEVLSEWHYDAILELMRLDNFKQDVAWIANVLSMPEFQIAESIEKMKRVGVISVKPDGKWEDLTGEFNTTITHETTTKAMRQLQKQLLLKSCAELENTSFAKRDHSSMTMAIDTKKLNEAKKIITKFRRQMASLLSHGNSRDQVYSLTVSLFPMSQNLEVQS